MFPSHDPRRDLALREKAAAEDAAKLDPTEVLMQGAEAMQLLFAGKDINKDQRNSLIAYRDMMMKKGGDDPLNTIGLEQDEINEVLYGSGRRLPRLKTKDGALNKQGIIDALNSGFNFVIIDGKTVSVQDELNKIKAQEGKVPSIEELAEKTKNRS